MASFFGEVVHPTSRAFWNDEDECETLEDSENVEFKVNWIESEPSEIEKFLIVEGEMMIDFVTKSLLENTKVVCNIVYESVDDCSKIYLMDNNVYICMVNNKVPLDQTGEFTEAIIPILTKSKNVYTFIAYHMSRFKTDEEICAVSVLRTLRSKKSRETKDTKIPTLSQPNIVTGVGAGALSYAEIAKLPCVMYILYTDTFIIDSKNALPLKEVFLELIGKVPNFTAGDSSFFTKGNLYM